MMFSIENLEKDKSKLPRCTTSEHPSLTSLQIENTGEGLGEKKETPTLLVGMYTGAETMENTIVQFSSITQSCPNLAEPMNHNTCGLPVHHQLLEFTQTHVH